MARSVTNHPPRQKGHTEADPSHDKSPNNHAPNKQLSDLTGEISGYTAKDLPYTHGKKVHYEPGIASANVVATIESPHGTTEYNWAEKHKHQTPLQQHVTYWDRDNDGVIWPQDTFVGIRAWGWSLALSLLVTLIIHIPLSWPTNASYLPDPFFRIWVSRIHRDKHGSDSMVYDNKGRFLPQNFEEFFVNYDSGNKGGLDKGDLWRACRGQRGANDPFGWTAAFLEWLATYLLIWPADGVLRKEDIRRVYDGSIFQAKADEHAARVRGRRA